jgi:hypothetical protein
VSLKPVHVRALLWCTSIPRRVEADAVGLHGREHWTMQWGRWRVASVREKTVNSGKALFPSAFNPEIFSIFWQ